MRVTLLAKSSDGLKASLLARTARQKQRLARATAENAQDLKETAQSLAEVDTGFYQSKIRVELSGDGFSCRVGVRAVDFLGKINPATGRTITFFYPLVLVRGSRHRAGNDIFAAALQLRKAMILERYQLALAG